MTLIPQTSKATAYLVSVGVSDYPGTQNDLALPANDAYTMYSLYKTNKQAKSIVLLNQKARVATINKALSKLSEVAKEEDIVVLFFSGHGVKGGFVCYDGLLTYAMINAQFSKCKSRHKFIFADACFSGDMRNSSKTNTPPTIHLGDNLMLFLSCRSNELSIERKDMKNGFFTYALQHGLRGLADANKDGKIGARELFDYVSIKVRNLSFQKQHPVMWGKFPHDMVVMQWK